MFIGVAAVLQTRAAAIFGAVPADWMTSSQREIKTFTVFKTTMTSFAAECKLFFIDIH